MLDERETSLLPADDNQEVKPRVSATGISASWDQVRSLMALGSVATMSFHQSFFSPVLNKKPAIKKFGVMGRPVGRDMPRDYCSIVAFTEFKKAFDRVWNDGLWRVLKEYNIGNWLIVVIRMNRPALFH